MANKYITDIIKRFPPLEPILLDEDWLNSIHLQLGALRQHIEEMLEEGNNSGAKEILTFLEENMPNFDKEFDNAIAVSMLEHINNDLKNVINKSFPKLATALRDITAYNNSLSKDKRVQDFLRDIEDEK